MIEAPVSNLQNGQPLLDDDCTMLAIRRPLA